VLNPGRSGRFPGKVIHEVEDSNLPGCEEAVGERSPKGGRVNERQNVPGEGEQNT
jgi:hypothetical protein